MLRGMTSPGEAFVGRWRRGARILAWMITLALVYTMLISAAIGLVLMAFDIKLDPEVWGFKAPIVVFLLILWPSLIVARLVVRERDRIRAWR
jgi:hypothetical protein